MRAPCYSALLIAAAALPGASAAPAAEALGTELKHCVAIASSEARLTCYDALAVRSANGTATSNVPTATPPAAAAPAPAIPAPAPRASLAPAAAPAPAIPAPPPNVALAPAVAAVVVTNPAPVAAPDPAEAARNFGLSSAQLHAAPQGPQSIEAHVAQVTVDQALRNFVVLENGQTWMSTDGGLQLDTGERVTIKRAALGSFMLVSTTSKHSYHVHRVR